jgi:tetratricopeptide (TPR) repeat protein
MSTSPQKPDETKLRETLHNHPDDWETRKQLAHLLYDQESFLAAADIIWEAHEIPSINVELAFAARILAKASPRKAIRLLTALLEHNRGKAVQNLALANALLHHGMVLQAVRFYGAALEADPTLSNPDLEHFILWTDDQETLWGDFKHRKPKLGELPWMKRDPKEALKLTRRISLHTTPVSPPGLRPAIGENLNHDLYQQKPRKGAEPTPPPAATRRDHPARPRRSETSPIRPRTRRGAHTDPPAARNRYSGQRILHAGTCRRHTDPAPGSADEACAHPHHRAARPMTRHHLNG